MTVFKLSKTNVDNDIEIEDKPKEDEKVVTDDVFIDGPISNIITKALNKEYAIESMVADGSVAEDRKERTKGIYVYCMSNKDLSSDVVIKTIDKLRVALDSEDYKEVVTTIEPEVDTTKNTGLLVESLESMGVKVLLTRNKSLETINDLVNDIADIPNRILFIKSFIDTKTYSEFYSKMREYLNNEFDVPVLLVDQPENFDDLELLKGDIVILVADSKTYEQKLNNHKYIKDMLPLTVLDNGHMTDNQLEVLYEQIESFLLS